MEFDWDETKAISNWSKHRVRFEVAAVVFQDPGRIERPDDSMDYDEERWITTGTVEGILLSVVYTVRGSKIRII